MWQQSFIDFRGTRDGCFAGCVNVVGCETLEEFTNRKELSEGVCGLERFLLMAVDIAVVFYSVYGDDGVLLHDHILSEVAYMYDLRLSFSVVR